MSDDDEQWRERWVKMSHAEQLALWERLSVTPFKIVLRPAWQKLGVAPVVWWKHYSISRKYLGCIASARWAFTWTLLLLFPQWMVTQTLENNQK